MTQQKANDQVKALDMLGKYLPDGATLYSIFVGTSDGGKSGTQYKRQYMVTSPDDGRIVSVSLYVANALTLRCDKHGNVSSRMTPQEVAEDISGILKRTVKSAQL